MSEYLYGLATIPAVLTGGYLLTAAAAWVIAAVGRLHLGVVRRIRPDDRQASQRRAAVMFGLRRGLMFNRGEFVLLIGAGLDEDRRRWAQGRLLRDLKRPATPAETGGGQ